MYYISAGQTSLLQLPEEGWFKKARLKIVLRSGTIALNLFYNEGISLVLEEL